ncbi:MAG: hypothetical protein IT378_04710 [Sandaracinaceae bacterium]|nr:hypothetical protein [Sandaracinaceae bacterium]
MALLMRPPPALRALVPRIASLLIASLLSSCDGQGQAGTIELDWYGAAVRCDEGEAC